MLNDGFVCKVARSAYVPDHLSLITDHCRMRALFIARPFLIRLAVRPRTISLYRLAVRPRTASQSYVVCLAVRLF